MRNPTREQIDGARAQKAALDFGLTPRALKLPDSMQRRPVARSPMPLGRPASATVPGAPTSAAASYCGTCG
jgi:hypothetical protein